MTYKVPHSTIITEYYSILEFKMKPLSTPSEIWRGMGVDLMRKWHWLKFARWYIETPCKGIRRHVWNLQYKGKDLHESFYRRTYRWYIEEKHYVNQHYEKAI